MDYFEEIISEEVITKGNIIDFYKTTVRLPNGKEATRDIIKHPGASVVIPVSEDGCIYLVRQYRTPAEQETLEIPAGKLDKGEDPAVCAERELSEETGFSGKITHLTSFYSTIGFSNEVLHMYIATDLKENQAHPDEDEFISTEKYKIDDLYKMILEGKIIDGKTISGILFACRYLNGTLGIDIK